MESKGKVLLPVGVLESEIFILTNNTTQNKLGPTYLRGGNVINAGHGSGYDVLQ